LRGSVLASLPFYDRKKVIALLDELPGKSEGERVVWDPVLMTVLSACVIQQRFSLGSKVPGNGAPAIDVLEKQALGLPGTRELISPVEVPAG